MLNWIKRNKLAAVLLVILFFTFFRRIFVLPLTLFGSSSSYESYAPSRTYDSMGVSTNSLSDMVGTPSSLAPLYKGSESVSQSPNRMSVVENSASVVVKDVTSTVTSLSNKATSLGGFEVSSNLNRPTESTSATLTVRVPSAKSAEFLDFITASASKVVSMNKQGRDVTDQYKDIDARLAVLEESYRRIDTIYDNAIDVNEMLSVQTQLFSLRDQIDSLKGQKKYLEDVASTQKYTIYLSTDEFSLPYAPEGKWRPDVTFKYAVRSLVQNLRGLGNLAIWIGVYSIIIAPVAFIIWFVAKKRKKSPIGNSQ